MLNTKNFLAIDFGAGSLKLAEFEVDEAGVLRLLQFGIKPLGAEGAQESKREAVVLKALQELIAERGIKANSVNVCAPGFHVFSKFVKLPPVDSSKVTQIIQYEAQQNVPFPLAEVVWDYQILGATPTGELEVLLVAIKADVVEGLFHATEAAGLSLQITDVSPAALCNAFRYNYGDLDDCTMLLDIGAKTSNLLFFEKGKVYARSINLGANSITQDFANESKLPFPKAEQIKIDEGFVSLGGAYEEPENPHQAAISKIARQFMTRLHIQVNQTMQFYRGQQGGSAPQRLFLSGGASVMPYTAQFFAEKLNVPVEYFNPFRNLQIDPGVNLEELARVAHCMGEVVGLGLRNLANCPVELNLMPESTLRWQSFNQKKPYFILTVLSLVLVVAATGWLFSKLADVKEREYTTLSEKVQPLQQREQLFKLAYADLNKATNDLAQVTTWIDDRYYWADVLAELRRILARVEDSTQKKLGADTGVWIEKFTSMPSLGAAGLGGAGMGTITPPGATPALPMGLPPELAARYMRRMPGEVPVAPPPNPNGMPGAEPGMTPDGMGQPGMPGVGGAPVANTNEISSVELVCRSVDVEMNGVKIAREVVPFALQAELSASPLFNSTNIVLSPQVTPDDANMTFSFGVTLGLKRPLKL
ncbi:MAG TPA: type IV pilus assembly protein PilM [Verrucomicrobiae bacterium]|nr:type IV pilus assembly protein PilM [Verrucomicrobiae bacterium]